GGGDWGRAGRAAPARRSTRRPTTSCRTPGAGLPSADRPSARRCPTLPGDRPGERYQLGQLVVLEAADPRLTGADDGVGQLALALEQGGHAVLDRPLGDQPVHLHRAVLADAVGAVGGLVLDRGVPPAVVVDHVGGTGEVEPGPAGAQ